MGSWTQILAATAQDIFYVQIGFNAVNVSSAIRDCLADIGVDPAGGTTYAVLIPQLLCSCAASTALCGDGTINYFFPVFIKAGSTVACRMSVNNSTVGTGRVTIRGYGQPSNPSAIKYGTSVVAYGTVLASSKGTTVVPGATGAAGTYVSLGATTQDHWFWQMGYGIGNAATAARAYHGDIAVGDGTNFLILIPSIYLNVNAATALGYNNSGWNESIVPSGTTLYGRMTCSGTAAATPYSMAAYGVT